MPTFATPEPISATIELAVGTARIAASDRADTVVEVRPSDPASEADAKEARQTRVEYANGHLLVKAYRRRVLFGKPGSIEVSVELPAGSRLTGSAAAGDFVAEGRLGDCSLKTAAGNIRLAETGSVRLRSAMGDLSIGRAAGDVDIATASGDVRVGAVEGAASIKNSNGDVSVGEAAGELRLSGANGDIAVERSQAAVQARTAYGSVRIGEVVRGAVSLQSGAGELEVGIPEGTAAWLDVSSKFGHVRNSLDSSEGPGEARDRAEVHARTGYGDVVIRRA